jgi:hypothetical protein
VVNWIGGGLAMVVLRGTIQNGEVRLAEPTDLPNGTEVTVLTNGSAPPIGIPDDKWPTDSEGVAQMLARMNRVEPFDVTPAEEAEIEAWRQKVKEHTVAKQVSATDSLFE